MKLERIEELEQKIIAWLKTMADPKHSDGGGLADVPQNVPDEYKSDGEMLDDIVEILEQHGMNIDEAASELAEERTTFVEFTYEGTFYHGYLGFVPNEIIAQGKQAMKIWLCEHGEPMEYDYDAFENEQFEIDDEEEKCSMCEGKYGPIINNEVCAVCTGIIEDEEERKEE